MSEDKPEHETLEDIMHELTIRKLNFHQDDLLDMLHLRACDVLRRRQEGPPYQGEALNYWIIHLANSALAELDKMYREYDLDFYLTKDVDLNYIVTTQKPRGWEPDDETQ